MRNAPFEEEVSLNGKDTFYTMRWTRSTKTFTVQFTDKFWDEKRLRDVIVEGRIMSARDADITRLQNQIYEIGTTGDLA